MSDDKSTAAPARDLALVAVFAALIAACALAPTLQLSAQVPITFQTLAVALSGAVLGARRGFLATALYLLVGFAGMPIFAGGKAGLAVLQGPSVGYLISFPLAAALTGWLVQLIRARRPVTSPAPIFVAGFASSVLLVHPLGMLGLMVRLPTDLAGAWAIDRWFWPGDVLKSLAMAVVAAAVHRAFPDLLTPLPRIARRLLPLRKRRPSETQP